MSAERDWQEMSWRGKEDWVCVTLSGGLWIAGRPQFTRNATADLIVLHCLRDEVVVTDLKLFADNVMAIVKERSKAWGRSGVGSWFWYDPGDYSHALFLTLHGELYV